MSDDIQTNYAASLMRGRMLRQTKRRADAEKYFQGAIGQNPSAHEGYYELALLYCDWPGHAKQALATIDRALSLAPGRPQSLALRAWILSNLGRNKDAVTAAGDALAVAPHSSFALNALARAHVRLQQWREAETNARAALAVDSHSVVGSNMLAVALRGQGRLQEAEAVSAQLLAQVPDSPEAQSQAGWSALEAGDHRRANRHFLEALRLDPNCDYARRGMLHSFNSRVWIYRGYFQFVSWLGKHSKGMRYFLIILIYIVYRLVVGELRSFGDEGVHWGMVIVALYLVIFGFGRSFGNLFLLLDPFARHALKGKEIGWSMVAGLIYGLVVFYLVSEQAWPQVAVLGAIILCFLWGVLSARFIDSSSDTLQPEESY